MSDSAMTQSSISVPVQPSEGGSGRTDLIYPDAADTMVGRATTDVFTGKKSFPTSALGAMMNMPAGTAPTSPNEGDIWFDGVNLYGRFNSVTIQMTNSLPARTTSSLSLSLVGAGATGTQISATKYSTVNCEISTSTTSSIGGPSTSLVALKKCSTNSSTEGNWTTIATLENDQTITLAIALNSIQVIKGQLSTDLDPGWFVKLVAGGSGTHTEASISAEQTVYG